MSREFLSAGADINAPRGDGSCATPLHIATDNSKDAIAEELVNCEPLALVDVHKRSPLVYFQQKRETLSCAVAESCSALGASPMGTG